jgi:hypothetical protein
MDVKLQTTVQSDFKHHQQDRTANTLATYFYATDKVALKSTPDGNCFFNAVSTLLTGDELRSTELRYRCCVEMTLNRSKIQAHPQFKRLTVLCPPYDDDCLHCAKPGTDSSMHMFIAMSQLLNLPIQVVYPAVNGSSHYNFKVSNTLLRPPFSDPDNGQLTLMVYYESSQSSTFIKRPMETKSYRSVGRRLVKGAINIYEWILQTERRNGTVIYR